MLLVRIIVNNINAYFRSGLGKIFVEGLAGLEPPTGVSNREKIPL